MNDNPLTANDLTPTNDRHALEFRRAAAAGLVDVFPALPENATEDLHAGPALPLADTGSTNRGTLPDAPQNAAEKRTDDARENGKGKGGAPAGNQNAQRHGLRGLRSDQAGKGFGYQDRENGIHNQRNTAAAIVVHGEPLPHYVLALLQSAGRHNLRALLAAKYLRDGKGLSAADRLNMLETIGRATDQRDRALKQAGLAKAVEHVDPNDLAGLWRAVDAMPEAAGIDPAHVPDGMEIETSGGQS